MTFELSSEQADRALLVCETFPPRPGMHVSPVTWDTIDAFWTGYISSWPDGAHRAMHEFAAASLGRTNLAWTWRLYEAHGDGEPRDARLDSDRGSQVSALVCAIVRDFVLEHRADD